MKSDKFGHVIYEEKDVFDLLYHDDIDSLVDIYCENTEKINVFKQVSEIDIKFLSNDLDAISLEEYDSVAQNNWFMPDEYKNFNIKEYCISMCSTDEEHSRVHEELEEFQKRNMIPLLQWLKYLVDICRDNNIVWGVGRGSSVSSFVLFLVGVHKIDPIKYDLNWQDFLR